jgi:hypothetical protein
LKKIIFSILCISSLALSSENIWSQQTQTLDNAQTKDILKDFDKDKFELFNFKDEDEIELQDSYYDSNFMVFGIQATGLAYSEKLSNEKGSKTVDTNGYNIQLSIGKDFTLWHKDFTQPSRIYFKYSYSLLDSDIEMTSWGFGLKENMSYYSFYTTQNSKIYPTFSIEIAKAYIDRDNQTIHGLKSVGTLGVTYAYKKHMEYFLDLVCDYNDWKHPVDGISDQIIGYGLSLGINYKIMDGDF